MNTTARAPWDRAMREILAMLSPPSEPAPAVLWDPDATARVLRARRLAGWRRAHPRTRRPR